MQKKRHYFAIACCVALPLLYGCATTNYGDNQFKLSMASSGKDVMWVPTKVEMADQMLSLAQVRKGDLVYDLGSGDGVIPIEAAKKYQVRAVGIEYNPDLVKLSQRNAERANVQSLVTFKQGRYFCGRFFTGHCADLVSGRKPQHQADSDHFKNASGYAGSLQHISHGGVGSGSGGTYFQWGNGLSLDCPSQYRWWLAVEWPG